MRKLLILLLCAFSLHAFATNALLIVNSTPVHNGDSVINYKLGLVFDTVTVIAASSSSSSDANSKELVFISATVNSADVTTKFLNSAVPVIVCEQALFDDMKMTGTTGSDRGTQSSVSGIDILLPAHPLAAGLSSGGNPHSIASSSQTVHWGLPNSNAAQVASIPSTPAKLMVFGYENGASMISHTAPARRVGFFLGDNTATVWTAATEDLFDAAVAWAANLTPSGTPPTVSITAPAQGATYTTPADITITATAADSDGTVDEVEFFYNSTSIGTDNSSPFSIVWNDAPAGNYLLTAVAEDDDNLKDTSVAVNITVLKEGVWFTSGNDVDGGDFIGTTNNERFFIKVNDTTRVEMGVSDSVRVTGMLRSDEVSSNILFLDDEAHMYRYHIKNVDTGHMPGLTMGYGYEGRGGLSVGEVCFAYGDYSYAGGFQSWAEGYMAHTQGYFAMAHGDHSFTQGRNLRADGAHSYAFGLNTLAEADYSFAFGEEDTATGEYAFAFGEGSVAEGDYSFAFGDSAKATEEHSFAAGNYVEALAPNSIAMGNIAWVKPSGANSLALGYNVQVETPHSLALGSNILLQDSAHHSAAIGDYLYMDGQYGPNRFLFGARLESHAAENITIGIGTTENYGLINQIAGSIMMGTRSNVPTLIVGPGNGVYNSVGNVGIGTGPTTLPANRLEINKGVADESGLRFTQLTSSSTPSSENGLCLSVDDNGDVILVPTCCEEAEERRALIDEQRSIIEELRNVIEEQRGVIDEQRKEFSTRMADVESKLNTYMNSGIKNASQQSIDLNEVQAIVLEQNVPNPFAEQTTISYFVPEDAGRAVMHFSDLSGRVIKSMEVQKGNGTLTVFAQSLGSGTYTYSLVVDGKVIETKKMLKTR